MSEYETTFVPVEPKSMAYIGSESNKTTIAIDQHFNCSKSWCGNGALELKLKTIIKKKNDFILQIYKFMLL